MARSPAQLRAIFAALRAKGPLARAHILRKGGVLKFGKRGTYMGQGLTARKSLRPTTTAMNFADKASGAMSPRSTLKSLLGLKRVRHVR